MINNFTFEYIYVFLLLISYFICLRYCKQKSIAIYFPNMKLLQKASSKNRYLLNIVKFLTFFTLVFTIASPVVEDDIVVQNDKGYEISLILDASGSMSEANKFDILKDIVTQFIDERKQDKLALSIFADFAYVAVPLTYDKNSIKRLLSRLEVGVAGRRQTALYEALFLGSNIFKTSNSKEKIAIILTDGVDNTDTIPLEVAIKSAKKYGIKVYTIGIGDFNPDVLKRISNETNGKYFTANTVEQLQNIYKTINQLEKSEIETNKYIKKTYYFQYSLAFSILFLLFYFYLVNKE